MNEFKTEEEYKAARDLFFKNNPDAPVAKDIKCLNLIMRKEFAEQILHGTKKLEYRAYSEHYIARLIDKDVAAYIQRHINDDDVLQFCNDIRQVMTIHFHNYSNSWYLDVECTFNDAFIVNQDGIDMLHEEYGVHDWDDECKRLDAMKAEHRPCVFYFAIGKVLKTNLK